MQKQINLFIYAFIVFVVFAGFFQLGSDNELFAESVIPCCMVGNCANIPCSSTATVYLGGNCNGYVLDCWDCMDFKALCDQNKTQQCIAEEREQYYLGNGVYKDIE